MSTPMRVAHRPTAGQAVQVETLGAFLALIRQTDLDSLHGSFEVPTIFAEMPWRADSVTVVDEADGEAEARGLQYVLEVALARDLLAGLAGSDGDPTEAECVEAVTAYSVTGPAGSAEQTSWVSRCLTC